MVHIRDGADHLPLTAEERFTRGSGCLGALANSLPVAVVLTDPELAINFLNLAAERLFGYGAEELRGKPLALLLPDHLRVATPASPGSPLVGNGPDFGYRQGHCTGIRKDGSRFPAEVATGSWALDGWKVCTVTIRDLTECRLQEEAWKSRERQLTARPGAILEPADSLDIEALQSLADSFYTLTGLGSGIIDLEGRLLVGTGWSEICTNFHRCHPETCRNCVESDLQLTGSVEYGKYVAYKCKNGMWDLVTPIVVDGRHVANLFLGQFFFEDESPDYDFFRQQAKKYGFDEKAYLAALDKAPRHSREKVRKAMDFYTRFAGLISQLSYSNLQMARASVEQKQAEEKLKTSLKEKEVLLKEVNHRVKNNLQIISSLLSLQAERVQATEDFEMFQEAQNRVQTMALIHEMLYRSQDMSRIPVAEYFRSLALNLFRSYHDKNGAVDLVTDLEDISLSIDSMVPLGLILNELVTNAFKYAFPDGRKGQISVGLHRAEGRVTLLVSDDGIGLTPGFDIHKQGGLGLELVESLTGQLNGSLELGSGKGTAVTIRFQEP